MTRVTVSVRCPRCGEYVDVDTPNPDLIDQWQHDCPPHAYERNPQP